MNDCAIMIDCNYDWYRSCFSTNKYKIWHLNLLSMSKHVTEKNCAKDCANWTYFNHERGRSWLKFIINEGHYVSCQSYSCRNNNYIWKYMTSMLAQTCHPCLCKQVSSKSPLFWTWNILCKSSDTYTTYIYYLLS